MRKIEKEYERDSHVWKWSDPRPYRWVVYYWIPMTRGGTLVSESVIQSLSQSVRERMTLNHYNDMPYHSYHIAKSPIATRPCSWCWWGRPRAACSPCPASSWGWAHPWRPRRRQRRTGCLLPAKSGATFIMSKYVACKVQYIVQWTYTGRYRINAQS